VLAKNGGDSAGHHELHLRQLTALTQNTLGLLVKSQSCSTRCSSLSAMGDKFLKLAMRVFPWEWGGRSFSIERFLVTARSTLKVTMIIGGIQGRWGDRFLRYGHRGGH